MTRAKTLEKEFERRAKISKALKGRARPALRKVTPELESEMRRLYVNGTLIRDIAACFGFSWYTVREYVKPEYRERRLQHQNIRRQKEVVLRALELLRESACVIDTSAQHRQLDELKAEMRKLNHRGI